jgi:hypothetical protein
MEDIVRTLPQDFVNLPGRLLAVGAALLGLAVVVWLLLKLLRRRSAPSATAQPQLAIDISALGEAGPPPGPPVLEFYNLPVRVAAIVLAPAGRVRELPPPSELAKLYDAMLPGLDQIITAHNPLIRRWPTQVSARGFAHLFFANAHLPGDGGKGTPWSAAAGIIKVEGQAVMAGLVLRAARPNGFGQVILDSEEKWLGCFRVRESAT